MFLNKSVVSSLCMAFMLSACSGSDGFGLGNGSSGDSSDSDSSSTTDPTAVVVGLGSGSATTYSSGVVTTGLASGEVLSYGGSTTASVNVVDTNSANALLSTPTSVLFSSACATQGLATIGASTVSSAGVATVSYTASSCTGSDTITATSTDDAGNTSTATVTFNISSLDLGKGSSGTFVSGSMTNSIDADDNDDADTTELTYGGDTLVKVNVVDTADNSLFTKSSVTVNFTSNCVQQGKSEISSSVNTTTGIAVATYTANTCEGPDVITASLSDGTSATGNITIADQVLGALEFVSASPKTIALKGSGSSSNPEVTTVSFSLKDATGEPMAGETISYALSTSVGGITLANSSSVTDLDGNTSVQLNAGGVNISVAVVATVEITDDAGAVISTTTTTSDPIAILGGVPDQDSFSLSVETFNPRGYNIDGTVSRMTIRAADRFNNQARDGTQISFITDGGSIVGSCELSGGSCSVNWVSQDPKPADGLVRILARTTGEESFTDLNSDGKFDLGEPIGEELDEAFLDSDRDGVRDAGEFFSDFNNNQTFDLKAAGIHAGKFQGANCSTAAEAAGHCQTLVDVRDSATICMSTDAVNITASTTPGGAESRDIDISGGTTNIYVAISDANGLTPANGTSVSVSVEDGEIVTGNTIVIPNQCVDGSGVPIPFISTIQVKPDEDTATTFGTLKVLVTRADGVVESYTVNLRH